MAAKDVMLDIETMALTPDALVLSIGAVKFDTIGPEAPWFGDVFLAVPDFMEQVLAGRRIDKATQDFWRTQPPEASHHWRVPTVATFPMRSVLVELADFVREAPRIWANGAVFDIGILEDGYRSNGLKLPWKYNAIRDARTAYDLVVASREIKCDGPLVAHHPVDDCKQQIIRLWERHL